MDLGSYRWILLLACFGLLQIPHANACDDSVCSTELGIVHEILDSSKSFVEKGLVMVSGKIGSESVLSTPPLKRITQVYASEHTLTLPSYLLDRIKFATHTLTCADDLPSIFFENIITAFSAAWDAVRETMAYTSAVTNAHDKSFMFEDMLKDAILQSIANWGNLDSAPSEEEISGAHRQYEILLNCDFDEDCLQVFAKELNQRCEKPTDAVVATQCGVDKKALQLERGSNLVKTLFYGDESLVALQDAGSLHMSAYVVLVKATVTWRDIMDFQKMRFEAAVRDRLINACSGLVVAPFAESEGEDSESVGDMIDVFD